MQNHLWSPALLVLLLTSGPVFGASVADYYKCTGRVSGEWDYGRAPSACDASAFGDDKVITRDYAKVVFADSAARSAERDRYVGEMHAIIRDAARYYLRAKKPKVVAGELEAWALLMEATASNESYWSHYRRATDGKYKMMRGDYGHGHGMMQIDDRSHFDAIKDGIGWNLIANLTYGMDVMYVGWERAPSQSCVGSATNYVARSRAAWAAYNGGSSSICRFTNAKSSWAQNDQNFYANLNAKDWLNHVVNPARLASVDVACLMENRTNCAAPGTPAVAALKTGVLYVTPEGRGCVIAGGQATCVAETRDRSCLNAVTPVHTTTATPVTTAQLATYAPRVVDRHSLCRTFDAALIAVGDNIQIKSAISLRATPGGGLLSAVPADEVVTVLDFELSDPAAKHHYYQVQFGTLKGWIYAGAVGSYDGWATRTTAPAVSSAVARVGQRVQIVTSSGINQRATPGGTYQAIIPNGTTVTVEARVIEGTGGDVYYLVTHGGRRGYIYSGMLSPIDTVGGWTKPL